MTRRISQYQYKLNNIAIKSQQARETPRDHMSTLVNGGSAHSGLEPPLVTKQYLNTPILRNAQQLSKYSNPNTNIKTKHASRLEEQISLQLPSINQINILRDSKSEDAPQQ